VSPRSIYLRDQATKCRRHADSMTDLKTQAELRKLAAEYDVQADRKQGVRPPQAATLIKSMCNAI
jgi:hypothetical protein